MIPTPASLSARAGTIKSRIRTLTNDIAAKAPAVLNGAGPDALAQVRTWQAERRDLADRLEVLEAAMRSPEVRLAGLEQRLNDQFRHQQAGLATRLRSLLADKYAQLRSRGTLEAIAEAVADLRDPAHLGIGGPRRIPLAELPHCLAAMLSREAEARYELAQYDLHKGQLGSPSQFSEEEKAKPDRLRLVLDVRTRHTALLLEGADLPELPEALRRFV